jgi:hypothetical protein
VPTFAVAEAAGALLAIVVAKFLFQPAVPGT